MSTEIEQLYSEYIAWLRDKTRFRAVGEAWTEITTPYLDRHNDCVQVYAKPVNGDYLITDDGYTIADLEQSGCPLDSPKRRALLTTTLNGFGVKAEGDQLLVRATPSMAPQKMHDLIQAILSVNDLFFLASPSVVNLFAENVQAWLDESCIRYTPDVRFTGKSGFVQHFDFVIPASSARPERVLHPVNNPTRQTVQQFIYAWLDTRETRRLRSQAYALLNDASGAPAGSVREALSSYDIAAVPWSDRESVREELAT